jgi:hypothetical protein
MLSLLDWLKVITLSGFYCISCQNSLWVFHKWRHVILNIFDPPLPPHQAVYSCSFCGHKIVDPLPLRPWRHKWITPYSRFNPYFWSIIRIGKRIYLLSKNAWHFFDCIANFRPFAGNTVFPRYSRGIAFLTNLKTGIPNPAI